MSTETDVRSPLHDVHVEAGAVFSSFAGWQLPLRFTGETVEHEAVRTAAGMFDLSHMGQIDVVGPSATAVLDRVVVSDVAAIRVGRAKYTLMCDEAGGVVDDLIVYRLASHQSGDQPSHQSGDQPGDQPGDRLLVIANGANAAIVVAGIEAAAEGVPGVRVSRRPAALVAVQGPRAVDVVADAVPDATLLTALRPYAGYETTVVGIPALVARTGYTGEDGFEVSVPAAQAPRVWRELLVRGADRGLRACGLAARDSLRLEAGMTLYGHELTRDTTPYEAGLGRVVALDKPVDFVGRDALRQANDRPPGRVLVALVAEGRRILRPGQPVGLAPGESVGTVTSGAWSPTLERSIALAYVPAAAAQPGTRLLAEVRGAGVTAVVVTAPFYRRQPPIDRPIGAVI